MEVDKLVLGRIANNTYFIIKENKCIVIDPSMEYERIEQYLKQNNLTVEAILITHGHFDHIYSLYELKGLTGAKVYMHQDDKETYRLALEKMRGQESEIDVWLSGGEVLNLLGEEIQVIHNPGHSPGCVTFVVGENMFTGDFIFNGSIGRTDFPGSNPNAMQASLEQFVNFGGDYNIYCGHGEDTTYTQELAKNPFLQGLK